MRISGDLLREAYLHACCLDVEAFKPGNVSVHSPGHGMRARDFVRSAEVSAPFLTALELPLGERIYRAAAATAGVVGCNTNLGILLLAAPLIEAAGFCPTGSLQARLRSVLEGSTREDAEQVYRAIRCVRPGGLGKVGAEDVSRSPSVTLWEAMQLAKSYDRVAFNYTFAYKDIYEVGIPGYHKGVYRWGDERWAAVAVFVCLLRRIPDTHIERKFGKRYTGMVQAEMASLEEELFATAEPERIVPSIRAVDARFKKLGINPGTTADLTVATLLAVRLEQLMAPELPAGDPGQVGTSEGSPRFFWGG